MLDVTARCYNKNLLKARYAQRRKTKMCCWFKMDNKKVGREGGSPYRRNFVKHSSAQAIPHAFDRHSDLCAACAGRDATPVATKPHDQVSDCVTQSGRGALRSQVGANRFCGTTLLTALIHQNFAHLHALKHHQRMPIEK
jgi:hypothetical protein